jgi:hypothetical protein
MSRLEAIMADLSSLPPEKLELAADFVHHLKQGDHAQRRRALDRAFGCLSEAEADEMERAISENCERIDAGQW